MLNDENSGNAALLHKHSNFNNTTDHVCIATIPISPLLLRDWLSGVGKCLSKHVYGLGHQTDSEEGWWNLYSK